jgi:hypothetical protein
MLERLMIFAREDETSAGRSLSRCRIADNTSSSTLKTLEIFDGGDEVRSENSSTRFLLADGSSELELTRLEYVLIVAPLRRCEQD